MERSDIEAVAEIERGEPSAWSDRLIKTEFECDYSLQFVACNNDRVVGWCCARLVGKEAELLKIVVARKFRRQSVGSGLLTTLLEVLEERKVASFLLEVRSRNRSARDFYHRLGFTPVGRRINYYSQPDDDACILEKLIETN